MSQRGSHEWYNQLATPSKSLINRAAEYQLMLGLRRNSACNSKRAYCCGMCVHTHMPTTASQARAMHAHVDACNGLDTAARYYSPDYRTHMQWHLNSHSE